MMIIWIVNKITVTNFRVIVQIDTLIFSVQYNINKQKYTDYSVQHN